MSSSRKLGRGRFAAVFAAGTLAGAPISVSQSATPTEVLLTAAPLDLDATPREGAPPVPAAALQPLWEAGIGIGALGYEDYRGADSAHAYPVPVPYLVYNGSFLRSDRDGLHGNLFKQPWVDVRLSFTATTPVSNDRTRSGMPQLKPTVELGAEVDFHLWRSADRKIIWEFRLPVRYAASVQAPPEGVGWTFTPGFALDFLDPFDRAGWKLGIFSGPEFADRRYNRYFYTVEPQDATMDRPAYQASAGYAGAQIVAALSKRFPRYWVGAFLRYDNLTDAVFIDSPLVKREQYWTAGFGIAWMIGRSSRMVEVAD
jgi:outer membrane scaffolding protein for murein synthesis (MipA/OmpV family)